MKIIKKCNVCQKEMETTSERVADNRGKYCSKDCQHTSLVKKVKSKCAICKGLIYILKSKKCKRHYCSRECRREGSRRFDSKRVVAYMKKGKGYFSQKLGRKGMSVSYDGYYWYSNKKVHRLLMERHLKRKLKPTEIVHHINFNKLDNRISNLQVVSRSEHNKIHKFLNS